MPPFDDDLRSELDGLATAGLRRELRRIESPQGTRVRWDDRSFLNFSSNDYLGLAAHPALREAAARASAEWGAGAGASRLICGSLGLHHQLEESLAEFKGTPAALAFSTGYAAAVGAITALAGPDDAILLDKLVHACCVDAARLSGAKLRVFRHNDLDDLEAKLQWASSQRQGNGGRDGLRRVIIVTESVFSMDGDLAPLRNIIELKERHGAWLMVDEAHATGLFGERRRGLVEEFQAGGQVEIQMGTLGKALGAGGGYIAGSRALVDLLIHRARSFVFSTAPVPAQSGAALAALGIVRSSEGETLRQRCWGNVDAAKNVVIDAGWTLPPVRSAILPLQIGDESAALSAAATLRDASLLIPAIRYPTVARGEARLRLTLSAAHTPADLAELGRALQSLPRPGSPPAT